MKTIRIQTLFARVLLAGFVVLTLSLGVAAASARSGDLHVSISHVSFEPPRERVRLNSS